MPKHTNIAAALAVALTALVPMKAHAQRGEADLMERLRSDIASDTYAQSDRQSGLKQALKLSAGEALGSCRGGPQKPARTTARLSVRSDGG